MARPREPRHGPEIMILFQKGVPFGTPFFAQNKSREISVGFPAVSTMDKPPKIWQNTVRAAFVSTHKNFSAFSGICHSHIHILCCIIGTLQ